MKHLRDDQIQDYIEGGLSTAAKSTVEQHLQKCSTCRKDLAQYKKLFHTLGVEKDFFLPPQFPAEVVGKIKKESLGAVHSNLWHIFLVLCGVIISINATLYYYDIKPFIEKVKTIHLSFNSLLQYIAPVQISLSAFQSRHNLDYHLVILVLVIMLILALVDRFILRSKHKFATFVF